VQTIKGEGMPLFEQSEHGDLFIEYNVVLPTEISPQSRRSMFPRSSLFSTDYLMGYQLTKKTLCATLQN
jgi:DnaJ-class molecular chaperone